MDKLVEINKGTLEKPEKNKDSILTLIHTVKKNKTLSKLIIYTLNTLKNILILSNQTIIIENSSTILNGIRNIYLQKTSLN